MYVVYYVNTSEIPGFFHLLKDQIERSEDTIYLTRVGILVSPWLIIIIIIIIIIITLFL